MPAPPSSPARPGKKGAGGAAPRPPLLIGSRRAGPPLRREEKIVGQLRAVVLQGGQA